MKVSNGSYVQKIYQQQVKKAKTEKSNGEFGKLMQNNSVKQADKTQSFQSLNKIEQVTLQSGQDQKIVPASFEASVQTAAKAVAEQPDIRAEKVARIKELFEAGQYNVPAEAVAEKLLASGVITHSWEA